jgi:hypothetical protein
VNASPEPVSNVVASSIEDAASAGFLALVLTHPMAAVAVAVMLLVFAVALIVLARRAMKALLGLRPRRPNTG